MSAEKTIQDQVKELREMWRELWWKMGGGTKSEYDRIKTTNLFEFWRIYDLWFADIERESETMKNKISKHVKR